MSKGFVALGHCCRCGDTEGPWSLYPGIGWLCDICAEEEDNKKEEENNEEEDNKKMG